ncbi:hypothetical protein BJ741DRAFT_613922 [Chytriomyces cf. hyalinus JEL632]|nr:hypothetical protein BJ741DRAFT_613922 [Chytriomyces cf. hyalinus JEL632]
MSNSVVHSYIFDETNHVGAVYKNTVTESALDAFRARKAHVQDQQDPSATALAPMDEPRAGSDMSKEYAPQSKIPHLYGPALELSALENALAASTARVFVSLLVSKPSPSNSLKVKLQSLEWALEDAVALAHRMRIGHDLSISASTDAAVSAHQSAVRLDIEELVISCGSHSDPSSDTLVSRILTVATGFIGWDWDLIQRILARDAQRLPDLFESLVELRVPFDAGLVKRLVTELNLTSVQQFGLELHHRKRTMAWPDNTGYELRMRQIEATFPEVLSRQEYDRAIFSINSSLAQVELFCIPVGARRRGEDHMVYLDVCVSVRPSSSGITQSTDDGITTLKCACRNCRQSKLDLKHGFKESSLDFMVEDFRNVFNEAGMHFEVFCRVDETCPAVLGFVRINREMMGLHATFAHLDQVPVTVFHLTGPAKFNDRLCEYALELKGLTVTGDAVLGISETDPHAQFFPSSERGLFECLNVEYIAPHERW